MALFAHIGVGFAAKPAAPKVPLFILLIAAIFLDILCLCVFLPLGIENISPEHFSIYWSHGLFMSIVWSAAAGILGAVIFHKKRAGIVIGLVVFSHWVLDFISHPMLNFISHPMVLSKPDIPLLFNGSPKVGLGLYSTITGELITEFGVLILGIIIYAIYKIKNRDKKTEKYIS